jgi:hypothetical protein
VAHMQGSLKSTNMAAYTLHEIQTPAGTVVREYMSSTGKVFAVAWKGPWLPDLKQLLGTNFETYQQAAQAPNRRVGHAPVSVHQANLVVEQGGHMRAFAGRAYLVDQLPAGVSAESIR